MLLFISLLHLAGSEVNSYTVNANIFLKRRYENEYQMHVLTANNSFIKVPFAGTIKSWTFYSNFKGLVAFYVLRPVEEIVPSYRYAVINNLVALFQNNTKSYTQVANNLQKETTRQKFYIPYI